VIIGLLVGRGFQFLYQWRETEFLNGLELYKCIKNRYLLVGLVVLGEEGVK
jgi:hypothetical protein